MAHTIKISTTITLDGVAAPHVGSLSDTHSVDEVSSFSVDKANDGDTTTFTSLKVAEEIASISFFVLTSDKQVTVRLDGQSDAGTVISAGDWVTLAGVTIDASATTNVLVNNNSGATATLKGLIGGT